MEVIKHGLKGLKRVNLYKIFMTTLSSFENPILNIKKCSKVSFMRDINV